MASTSNAPPTTRMKKLRTSFMDRITRPEFQTGAIQVVKTIFATTLAWWISVNFLNTSFPFLAPWTALLTIQATAYRTLSRGAQSTIASVLGIAVTFLVGHYLGVTVWTYALALLIGLAIARIKWIREEGITVATTAIFLLSDGFTEQSRDFGERMLEILMGIFIGVLVNMLVMPPLRDRQASNYINNITRRMGEVLEEMGTEVSTSWNTERAQEWINQIEAVDSELNSAWSTVRFARESRRINPRQRMHLHKGKGVRKPVDAPDWEDLLDQAKSGVSNLRSITTILHTSTYADGSWDEKFREQWAAIARDTGQAITEPPDNEVAMDSEQLRKRLDDLAHTMSEDRDLPRKLWPVYGSLITSLRHIVALVDDVNAARREQVL